MLNEEALNRFKASLHRVLIQPGAESYDVTRKIYNGMINRHPNLIARCTEVADVITAVNFVRQTNMPVAINGGATILEAWVYAMTA